jgi:tetratricopeptide (TPR) repeat protein
VTAVLSDAQARESANDLYGANELLVAALQKLPHSTRLNEYKRQIDTKRAERRKENERRALLAQAEYFLAQQEIYNEHLNLDTPGLVQSWKNSLSQHQAHGLAQRLLTCGQETLQDNLDMADKCLRHAAAIKDSPEVQAALSQLETRRAATRQREEKTVLITQGKEEKKPARKQKNKTQEVLEKTVLALDDDDLPAARRIFHELPKIRNESREVAAVRSRLHEAIESRVKKLTSEGDKRYRADNVNMAIRAWEKALELDPDNPELTERLERARKVLARLEELKSRQSAPERQHKQGT